MQAVLLQSASAALRCRLSLSRALLQLSNESSPLLLLLFEMLSGYRSQTGGDIAKRSIS